jgi:hypothetical protein
MLLFVAVLWCLVRRTVIVVFLVFPMWACVPRTCFKSLLLMLLPWEALIFSVCYVIMFVLSRRFFVIMVLMIAPRKASTLCVYSMTLLLLCLSWEPYRQRLYHVAMPHLKLITTWWLLCGSFCFAKVGLPRVQNVFCGRCRVASPDQWAQHTLV